MANAGKNIIAAHTASGRKRSARMIARAANTRHQILQAAARIVGRHGYAGCSIARIADRAQIAQGTFYLYFDSQQDLFDELLPSVIDELLNAVGEAVKGARTIAEMEELGLRANLAFLKKHPHVHRLTTEADVFSPRARRALTEMVREGYRRMFRRVLNGDAPVSAELEAKYDVVGAMIEGARLRLIEGFGIANGRYSGVPEDAIQAYLQFVVSGVEAVFGEAAARPSIAAE